MTDDYVYFINGYTLNTADNTFGTPLKGSIQRISKDSIARRDYTASETVVPLVAYSSHYYAGIYIYGDRIYYATPSTARNSTGEIQNSNLEFKSSSLDGRETMSNIITVQIQPRSNTGTFSPKREATFTFFTSLTNRCTANRPMLQTFTP